jgi:biopolymer transport protein ExbD
MFAGDSGSSRGVMAEMNITPLVDVMLVLLVIFMIAAPMVTRSIDLRLPQVPPPGAEVTKPPHLSLRVLGDGQFTLEGAALGEAALASALGAAARRAPDTVVDVAVSEDADYQAFTTALATARRSGIGNIALQ